MKSITELYKVSIRKTILHSKLFRALAVVPKVTIEKITSNPEDIQRNRRALMFSCVGLCLFLLGANPPTGQDSIALTLPFTEFDVNINAVLVFVFLMTIYFWWRFSVLTHASWHQIKRNHAFHSGDTTRQRTGVCGACYEALVQGYMGDRGQFKDVFGAINPFHLAHHVGINLPASDDVDFWLGNRDEKRFAIRSFECRNWDLWLRMCLDENYEGPWPHIDSNEEIYADSVVRIGIGEDAYDLAKWVEIRFDTYSSKVWLGSSDGVYYTRDNAYNVGHETKGERVRNWIKGWWVTIAQRREFSDVIAPQLMFATTMAIGLWKIAV